MARTKFARLRLRVRSRRFFSNVLTYLSELAFLGFVYVLYFVVWLLVDADEIPFKKIND